MHYYCSSVTNEEAARWNDREGSGRLKVRVGYLADLREGEQDGAGEAREAREMGTH